MACGSCGARRRELSENYDLMGNFKHLSDRQIRARLEVFKKKFCSNCNERFNCNYEMFVSCKNKGNQ